MLQNLLADRFKLILHNDTKPVAQYVLTLGKGRPKFKEADGSGEKGCQPQQQQNVAPGTVRQAVVVCHNRTMAEFAEDLHQLAGGYLTSPVMDSTGLKGSWDLEIRWTERGQLAAAWRRWHLDLRRRR